ncbi:MAG: DUF2723 domain-containing protein [Candidatus Eisenbacteria bacterium]
MAWLAGGALFALYLLTLCPTVYVGDSGELITAASVLGIAHPPGYPLYVLLGRLFSLFPFGSVALRVNLMSSFFGAGAAVLLYRYVRLLLARSAPEGERRPFAEGVAALTVVLLFGAARTVWGESVKAEVYSLHLFAVAAILLVAESGRRGSLTFFLLGLAAANHPTALLLVPGLAFRFFGERRPGPREIAGAAAAFAGGVTLYLSLLVRPSAPELFAWRKPETLAALWTHVTRGQYGGLSEHSRSVPLLLAQIVWLVRLLAREGGPVLLLLPVALHRAFRPAAPAALRTLVIHFVFFSVGLLLLLNHGVDARDGAVATVFYLPAVLTALALAAVTLRDLAARLGPASSRFAAAALLLPALSFVWNGSVCDARGFTLADDIGRAVLDGAPMDALLLSEGDNNTFVLHYLQIAEGRRRDVTVLDRDLNLFPRRFDGSRGDPVDRETRDRVVEEAVRRGERPVCSVNAYTRRPVAGKRLASIGPLYRFIGEGEEVPPSDIERYHPGGFGPGPLRGDYLARRFAVSYLSRWADHYRETGNEEGIASVREKILAVGEGLKEAHLVVGEALAAAGDTAAAIEEIDRSVRADPEFLRARRELADLLLADGVGERAVEEYRRLVDMTGRPGDRLNLANALLLTGDREGAAEEYGRVAAEAEGDSTILFGVATGYENLGRTEEWARALESLRGAHPGMFAHHEDLGDAYDRLGKGDPAREAYREAIRRDPGNGDLSYKLGLLLLRQGSPGVAEGHLARAIELDPAHSGALNALAYLYGAENRNLEEALEFADRAIRAAPPGEAGYYHDTRGVILGKLGRDEEAAEAFRLALRETPEWDRAALAETWDHLGELSEREGDGAGAAGCRARADSIRGRREPARPAAGG